MRIHLRANGSGADTSIIRYTNSHHRVRCVLSGEQPTSEFVYRWRTMLFPHAVAKPYSDLLLVDNSTRCVAPADQVDTQIVSFAWDFVTAAARIAVQHTQEPVEMHPDDPTNLAVYTRNQMLTALAHKSHYRNTRAIAWEEWWSWCHSQRFARLRVPTTHGLTECTITQAAPWRQVLNWDTENFRTHDLVNLTAETQELQRKLNSDIFE